MAGWGNPVRPFVLEHAMLLDESRIPRLWVEYNSDYEPVFLSHRHLLSFRWSRRIDEVSYLEIFSHPECALVLVDRQTHWSIASDIDNAGEPEVVGELKTVAQLRALLKGLGAVNALADMK